MATKRDIEFTYSLIDRIFRLSLGDHGDFSGAKYDGDFTLPLEEAQRRKHEHVAASLRLAPGARVLDLGCGWGPLMTYLRGRGVAAVGVTLSSAQARACRRRGLDVHVMDAREVTRDTFGPFDAVASLGAFEHFCSPEEWRQGRQEPIYARLFRNCHGLLPHGGRMFVQTMVFGPNMIAADEVDADAPFGSDAHVMAVMQKTFPGSWLPYGAEQVERCATPGFRLVSKENGRLDYIETIRQWRRRFAEPSLRKLLLKATLVPRWLVSRDFRMAVMSKISANTICFERLIIDHWRFVFERLEPSEP